MGKTKAHTRYEIKMRVPGVTTVTGLLNKPWLIPWANKKGLEGIDTTKYVDEMADIGTLAHYLIMCHLKGILEPDVKDYSANQIDAAENCLVSYFEWEKTHPFSVILVEQPLVSERYKFGGTPDLLVDTAVGLQLIDFKTGSGVYPEHFLQLAAYKLLLEEHGHHISRCRILRIPRSEDEGFDEKVVDNLDTKTQIFLKLLEIYWLQKQDKKEARK